jgi:hypothetical protein
MRLARFALWLSALASLAGARAAAAAEAIADAGASAALPAALAPRSFSACVEHIPEGKTRPAMTESFPERAKAGYAATLHLELQHGLGESVLPGGFKLQLDSPEGKALGRAQFVIPALEGPAAPRISRTQTGSAATTSVDLSFVPLPKEPGPHTLTLPSVPIAIARASGERITVCTAPHELLVDDPTANLAQATPRPNPLPQRQLEVWTAAKNVALGALIALPLGALIAFLVSRWLRRQRPLPPPPPPRPAWELALEALALVRGKRLIDQGLNTQHFAEVSLAVRDYLGRRFGFDGLESTTREILEHLEPVRPEPDLWQQIERLLRRADLVKFANLTPERAECELVLEDAEQIVRRTMREEPKPEPLAPVQVLSGPSPGNSPAGHPPPASPPTAGALAGSPVAGGSVADNPVAASPVAASPVAASPVAASPVAGSRVAGSPVAGGPSGGKS